MRLLLVEDEKSLAIVLKKGLEEQGFTVELSFDGEDGLFLAQNYAFDVILLDIMLPNIDGLELLQTLRKSGVETPVLMVTAKREMNDKVTGLESGADDYISKPFDFPEVVARIRSAIRRNKGKPIPVVEIADLAIDTNARVAIRAGNPLGLSSKEYDYLEYLALNHERVVSRNELLDHLYSASYDFDSNIIDVYISNLRRKVDRGFDRKLIHTVRGRRISPRRSWWKNMMPPKSISSRLFYWLLGAGIFAFTGRWRWALLGSEKYYLRLSGPYTRVRVRNLHRPSTCRGW